MREWAATITKAVQTGTDAYRDVSVTKIFNEKSTLEEIEFWATVKGATFQEVLLSDIEKDK